MSTEDDFTDPSGAGNFLQRYHQARAARVNSTPAAQSQPTSPATKPLAPPALPLRSKPIATQKAETAKSVWGAVFHPLGRSPTSADRYDLSPKQRAAPGFSTSEVHAKGSGISLDDRRND